jgi:integrase
MAIKKAIEWEYLNKFKFPKQFKLTENIRYLTSEQLSSLFDVIDNQEFSDFCLFCCYTGLRSGEICRLNWDDIDNPPGFIRIKSEQKNRKEDRIPIHEQARIILEKRRKDSGGVFIYNSVDHISHKFKEYAVKAGLNSSRFHDLRHTYASHLAMAGEDLKSIQELMRHRSIASTMVYAKVSPDHLKEVNSRLSYDIKNTS